VFKKAAVFTDIHFGLKSNSKTHNDDCEEFIDWFIEQAKLNGCETGIFCGDWNHNRNSLNLTTMDAGIRSLEKLGAAFEQFYMFAGNHDLYYKDKRDIKSTEFARLIPGITVVDNITVIDDVALVPWLVGEEWKRIPKLRVKYMFGHFELPNFLMNAMVKMPETGELRPDDFQYPDYIFSGHFHKRQQQDKIHYIGNALPHNYADAWDDNRGMMILDRENNKEPEYINWPDCPKYRTISLSKLIADPEAIIKSKMYIRASIDVDIVFEEANYIKELFLEHYKCRELTLISQKNSEELSSDLDISSFSSVDQIVANEIAVLDVKNHDRNLLLEIYNGL
jgi:DNA repair exonuclease SbcCD nuclease subunit